MSAYLTQHLLPPPPTRLAVVTETWPPEVNGVAFTIQQLVQGLCRRGTYQIELVRPRQYPGEQARVEPGLSEKLMAGLALPCYRSIHIGLPQYWHLKRHWQTHRPDLVQVVTEGPLGYAAVHAARALHIPVISDFHTHFDQYSRYYRLAWLGTLASRYLRHLHNLTHTTLVPTRALAQQLADQGYRQLGILERGIDRKRFNPAQRSNTLREKLGIQPGQLLVLLVSRLACEKNLDLAFAAFAALRCQQPDAQFLLVGDGPERRRLEQQYPHAHFAGIQTGGILAEYYASSDLFLYPSTSETFGNVVLEAMASGLPVVAFDYAAAHEHIRSGINGMTAALDDEAGFIRHGIHLANAPLLRRHIGMAACQTTRQLGWDHVAEQLHNTIQTVLSEVNAYGYEIAAPA